MLTAALLIAPLLLAQAPTKEQVQTTLTDIETAFESKEISAISNALERAASVPDKKVVKAVSRALKDRRPEIRRAAVSSFRYLDHKDALEHLHKLTKSRKWMEEREVSAAILRAIGQHGDPTSVQFLHKGHEQTPYYQPTRARVFGLGNIRTKKAVDALIELMNLDGASGNPHSKRRYDYLNHEFRLSLVVLTGVDQGTNPELWAKWWRKNKKGFEISKKPTPLPKSLRDQWDRYWGRSMGYSREKKREDRGS